MSSDAEDVEWSGASLPDPAKRKQAFSSPYIHTLQRRHFVLFDVLPAVGTAIALALTPVVPVGRVEIALLFAMWLLTGLGVTVGYHRLFTHRSFKATPAVVAVLAALGAMAGQGGVISWSALHRRHHELSDQVGDPHSPNLHEEGLGHSLRALLHAHFSWMVRHDYPSVAHYVPDLLRDKMIIKIDRLYFQWILLGILVPAALGGLLHHTWMGVLQGFLWGGVVRMFVLEHTIWSINSFLHRFGTRLFATPELSHNSALFSMFTLGESWHNNHHAFPASASFGLAWYRLDPGYWLIASLGALGLAWDVKVPSPERIRARQEKALVSRHHGA